MLSRREMLSGSVLGSLGAGSDVVLEPQSDSQQLQALKDIKGSISDVEAATRRGYDVSQGAVPLLRKNMDVFIKSHGKWPDYMDIGTGIFYDIYDWHVRNRQQILVTRQPDGKYTMQFMFTTLVLLPNNDPAFISYPYDKG